MFFIHQSIVRVISCVVSQTKKQALKVALEPRPPLREIHFFFLRKDKKENILKVLKELAHKITQDVYNGRLEAKQKRGK